MVVEFKKGMGAGRARCVFKATRVSKEKQGLIRGGAQVGVWSVSERMS